MKRRLGLALAFASTLALAACDIPADPVAAASGRNRNYEDADTGSLLSGQQTGAVDATNTASFGGHSPVVPGRAP